VFRSVAGAVSSQARRSAVHHPVAVAFDLPELTESIAEVETELRAHAARDQNGCCGYFPALEGVPGIECNLPARRALRESLPSLEHRGDDYRFNFIRLSLTQQSADPAFHLD
jgi:hypothetical protein